jgi:hypothetical protein
LAEKLAKFLSYLFHPLLMPSYGLLLFLNIDPQSYLFLSFKIKAILLIMTFIFTCLLPIANVWLLVKTKFISNFYLDNREERNISYLTTLIFYIAEYYLLNGIPVSVILKLLLLGATLSVALAFAINFWWKISAHMIGIGGMAGAMLAVNSQIDIAFFFPIILFIAGLIGFARLALQAHTNTQVYIGFCLGFVCEWGLFQAAIIFQ